MKRSLFDWGLFFSIIVLASLSLLILFSINKDLFFSQLIFFLVGLLFFTLFTFFDIDILVGFSPLMYLSFLIGLIFTLIFGENIRGSTRWINVGVFSVQFSEILKPFFLIYIAAFLSSREKKTSNMGKIILLSFPILLLIYKQPDLGNTLVYLFLLLGIFLALGYIKEIIISLVLLMISLPPIWHFLAFYQKQRILTFLNPGMDPQGAGYNALQAAITVGSGGLLGKGLGKGTQSHLEFLPERHTDFIFASYAEEFGFLGSMILILIYFFLLSRLLKIAQSTNNRFYYLYCLGVFTFLSFQIFINIGMNIGLVPITGITLPLVSYGGSSILSTMITLGIVESIARKQKSEESLTIK